jgi:copper transport protein
VTRRWRTGVALVATIAALVAPAAASAHATLSKTSPSASVTLPRPPAQVSLSYSEPIEARFAIVSVTDATGKQVTAGSPHGATGDPATLVTRLKPIPSGWYLVYWRVVSADGHPVRGAFTFAVGPNAGPAPQFVIPSLTETATTTRLLIARWIVFLSVMISIGLFVLRAVIARPLLRRLRGSSLRHLEVALALAVVVALVAIPVYTVLATAQFALRSAFDLGAIFPLLRGSAFGRAYIDLELVFGLFALAAGVTLLVDRPEREHRSLAELLSLTGALLAAAACVALPGIAGHAGQTSPRGLSLPADALHVAAGSVWVGGLVGLLVLWRSLGTALRVPALSIVIPRFSRVAMSSVILLIASGVIRALEHLPTLASLWQTSYGKTLLVKIGLLLAAMMLAAGNQARTKPRLEAAATQPTRAAGAAVLLRRLVTGELVFVFAAIFAAAVLSSVAPPSKALSQLGSVTAHVGPGPVARVVQRGPYRLEFRVAPNRAALPNDFGVRITRGGKSVTGAEVVTRFDMLDMTMGELAYKLREVSPGTYRRSAPALVMVGHWGLRFEFAPRGDKPFEVLLLDRAGG